ncbi:MAG: hypothetical protein WDO72_14730 [Pseudomonadota bacterium]
MAHPATSVLPFLIALPLIGWRLYRRVRSAIGRQKLSKVRPWVTVSVFPLIIALLAFGARSQAMNLLCLVGGLCVGTGLGVYGLSKTRFEATPQGLFYTPNAHLGIALSVLFTGRVIYRILELYLLDGAMPAPQASFASSPLTLAVFGLLAGYYVTYAIGLIRWRRDTRVEAVSGVV